MRPLGDGHVAEVTVRDRTTTSHRVRVSRAERERYRGASATDDEVADLVRRSFEFLLAREPNTEILREFDLDTIARYFPDYPVRIAGMIGR